MYHIVGDICTRTDVGCGEQNHLHLCALCGGDLVLEDVGDVGDWIDAMMATHLACDLHKCHIQLLSLCQCPVTRGGFINYDRSR